MIALSGASADPDGTGRGEAVASALTVLASDAASVIDCTHSCGMPGCDRLDRSEAEGVFTLRIRKSA